MLLKRQKKLLRSLGGFMASKKNHKKEIKRIVKEGYREIAKTGCSCCGKKSEDVALEIGYAKEELNTPGNLGLGCGNPIAMAGIKKGDVVLDLGSGAGFDCFLASRRTGETGKVIGVDMTEEMIDRARTTAAKHNYKNVEFRLGEIEDLPIEDNSVDIIISNCVINLSPDKKKVFEEAYRVLKKNGKMYVSDIVLLGELTEKQRNDKKLISGCVAGALQKEEYLDFIKKAGFSVKILGEDKDISKKQYNGIALESLKVEGIKNGK